MKISKIFIATHKYDLRFTRICVASIRYWYPQIPIYLIKDYLNGDFSTQEIEEAWNVRVFDTERTRFGWGFSKLEPLFIQEKERFLTLDSDIVFTGKVLDYLDEIDGDFVVQLEQQTDSEVNRLYFSLEKMKEWDPGFVFPNYTFNSGQVVGTGGLVSRDDFEDLVDWETLPVTRKHPEVFTMGGDQGVLNYLLMKKASINQLTIARTPFMKWGEEELKAFSLEKIAKASPYPYLIHWAGLKKPRLSQMIRSDILFYFENCYYAKIRLGSLKKQSRIVNKFATENFDLLRKRTRKVIPRLAQVIKGNAGIKPKKIETIS